MKNKFIKVFQRLLNKVFKHNLNSYLFLINTFFKIFSKGIKANFDKENRCIYITEKYKDNKFYILIPGRAVGYFRGLNARFEGIASNYFLNKIELLSNDIVIDIGANIGELYGFVSSKTDINYFGFEPSKSEFKVLSLNASSGTLFNEGCWNKNTTLDFYVASESADSSFEKPSAKIEDVITQKVTRLDSIFENEQIKFIKMDGEGCELEILQGMENILSNIEFISVDAGYERGINNECTFKDVSNYLYQHGFILDDFQSTGRILGLFRNSKKRDLAKIS